MEISVVLPSIKAETSLATTDTDFASGFLQENKPQPFKFQQRLRPRFAEPKETGNRQKSLPKLINASEFPLVSTYASPISIHSLSPIHHHTQKPSEIKRELTRFRVCSPMSEVSKVSRDRTLLMKTRKRLERTPKEESVMSVCRLYKGNRGGISLVGSRVRTQDKMKKPVPVIGKRYYKLTLPPLVLETNRLDLDLQTYLLD